MTLESADREELLARLQQGRLRVWPKRDPNKPISYNGAHRRIYRTRGPASDHTCVCGVPAETWAYDHKDPNELTEMGGGWDKHSLVRYSPDPQHYLPMCRKCHTILDVEIANRRSN